MALKFDHGRPMVYFTSNFIKNHIFIGNEGEKKKAETVFQRRGKDISTVLCLSPSELRHLAAEIFNRQDDYRRRPEGHFTTLNAYDYWSRGGDMAKDRQRAKPGKSRFEYAVRITRDGVYTLCHFQGLA